MILTISAEKLKKNLSPVIKNLASRQHLPVLENVHIEAKSKNKVLFTSVNLETTITCHGPAEVEKEGRVILPGKTFSEYVNVLNTANITLRLGDKNLLVQSGSNEAEFAIGPLGDFPPFTAEGESREHKLPVADMENVIRKAAFAASTDESRPVLSGIYFRPEQKKILFAAADGYRLSVVELALKKNTDLPAMIVPAKPLMEITRLAREDNEDSIFLGLAAKKKQMLLTTTNCDLLTRLVEGEFPAFERIIPADSSCSARLPREELFSAVKTAAVFAREAANIVKLNFEKNTLTVSADSPQLGKNTVKMPVKTTGEPVAAAFNYRYLLDFLNSLDDEEIIFETKNSLSPALFKGVQTPDYLHVIMPVRLQE